MNLSLVNSQFIEGRDIRGRLPGTPALADLMAVTGLITGLSATSTLQTGAVLLKTRNCVMEIQKCNLRGLRNSFARFIAGSVVLAASTFSDSVCPVEHTNQDAFIGCNLTDGETKQGIIQTAAKQDELVVRDCVFFRCTTETGEGSAILCKGGGTLTVDHCEFTECNGKGKWGVVIYSELPKSSFDRCTVQDCVSYFSAIHLKNYDTSGHPFEEEIIMTGNTFSNITMTGGDGDGKGSSGSGLRIEQPRSLKLVDCHFVLCRAEHEIDGGGRGGACLLSPLSSLSFELCTFEDTWAWGRGGALCLDATTGGLSLTIKDTTFNNCSGSEGGCIYVISSETNNLKSCIIDNCTIDSCNGRDDGKSLVIDFTEDVSINILVVERMYGQGAIRCRSCGRVSFAQCTFHGFGTGFLVDSGESPLALVVDGCIFSDLIISGSNLLEFGQSQRLSSLVMNGCSFTSVTSEWALIRCPDEENVFGVCEIKSTRFTNVSVAHSETSEFEPIVWLSSPSQATLFNVSFYDIPEAKNGLLVVTGSQAAEIDLIEFKNCDVNFTRLNEDVVGYPLLFIDKQSFEDGFGNCYFRQCSIVSSPNTLPIASFGESISKVKDCVFDDCSSSAHIVEVPNTFTSDKFTFENCSFENIKSSESLLFFNVSVSVSLKDTVFSNVKEDSVNGPQMLIQSEISVLNCELDHVTVTESKLYGLVDTVGTLSVTTGIFETDQIIHRMFMVTGASAKFYNCTFETVTGNSIIVHQPPEGTGETAIEYTHFTSCSGGANHLIQVEKTAKATVLASTFTECSAQTLSLIYLNEVKSIALNSSCFQGTTKIDGVAAYIESTTTPSATLTAPLCFDLPENSSVDFNDARPWVDQIDNWEGIFECSECGSIPTAPPTPEPETDPGDAGGMPPGAIAGIVIGVLLVIAIVVLLVLFLLWRKKKRDRRTSDEEDENVEDEATIETATMSTIEEHLAVTEESPFMAPVSENNQDFDHLFEETEL